MLMILVKTNYVRSKCIDSSFKQYAMKLTYYRVRETLIDMVKNADHNLELVYFIMIAGGGKYW